jgi:ABC-type multidrug transport system ATPase subunit
VRIEVRNVTVDFKNPRLQALRGVDLRIEEGERVALLGPSGSGKTTLLRLLLGAVRPTCGTARVGGLDPFGAADEIARLRRRTGCVRQRDDLVGGVTARTNALTATAAEWRLGDWLAVLRGRAPRRYADRLDALARRYGIETCMSTRVDRLSGGQRQRVALVRALLTDPRLLLADEPTTGLDPRNVELVVDAVRDSGSRTVLITTHDLDVAGRFSRVVALRGGRVVYDGPPPAGEALKRIYCEPEFA